MANDEAWEAGAEMGGKSAKKHRKNKYDKSQDGSSGSSSGNNPWSILSYIPKLHKGGKVRKTGVYRLRKGEAVLTVRQQKSAGLKKHRKASGGKRTAIKR